MTPRSLLALLVPLALTACVDQSSPSSDDDYPLQPGEPLAPADPAKIVVTRTGSTTPLTQWQAGDVSLGSSASIGATLTNTGGSPTTSFHFAIAGANANQFSFDTAHSDCLTTPVLNPGAQCGLVLVFTPTGTPGPRAAQVNIFGAPTLAQIGMRGNAVDPTNSIVTDVTALDFGSVDLDDAGYRNVVITNTGTGSVSLSRPTVGLGDPSFEVFAYDCGPTLAAGASCAITVRFLPVGPGVVNDQLTITTAANSPVVSLTGTGTRFLTVTWTGNGTITAVPSLLTCSGMTCTGHFPGDISITAVPLAGSSFVAWTPVCGVNLTCTLPADDTAELTLNATFSP